jgi:hypothetical protein
MAKIAKLGRPRRNIGNPKIISISKENADKLDAVRAHLKEKFGLDLSYNSALNVVMIAYESKQK